MFELLYKYNGNLLVNGKEYKSVYEADKEFGTKNGGLTIVLNPGGKRELNNSTQTFSSKMFDPNKFYQISVMSYMTNYKDDFFLATSPQIKNTCPMPFIVMVGRALDETNKLVNVNGPTRPKNIDSDKINLLNWLSSDVEICVPSPTMKPREAPVVENAETVSKITSPKLKIRPIKTCSTIKIPNIAIRI